MEQVSLQIRPTNYMFFKFSDEIEEVRGEMLAHQLEFDRTDDKEEDDGMVSIVVTIDEELLRRLSASDHSDMVGEGITNL